MSYALPPRDNRRRTSRRRSHGVAMHDSFPSEELLLDSSDNKKCESPILRSDDDDDNSIAKPIDNDDDAANDDETFSMSNSIRLATRDDINNDCEVDDYAQQLPDTASGQQSIEQYGSLHKKWILSSVFGVAIIGVSMIDGADREVVFTIVCILAIIVIRNSLNKLIHQHHDDSRLSSIASSLSDNRGLYSRRHGRSSSNNSCQSSPPRLTFEFGLRNNAPAHSSSSSSHHHKNWRQVKTMTNNIKSADSPFLMKKKSSSIVRPKALAQLLEERKSSSSSILFASDSIAIKPPTQTLERLEKRDKTIMRDEHKQ